MPARPAGPGCGGGCGGEDRDGAGRGGPRLDDAARDALAAALADHYAEGRIDEEELRRRVGLVLESTTLSEAAAALVGLPSSVEAVLGPPPRRPRPGSRKRYAERERPEPGWLPTAERFRDPATGRVIRVFIDPADSSRHYVPDATG